MDARQENSMFHADGVRQILFPAISLSGMVLIVVVLFTVSNNSRARNVIDPSKYPVSAINWMSAHPTKGNLFNQFEWGGYILFRLWPEEKVFIDGQTDFYGESVTREYESIINTYPGWESLLEKYMITKVLVPPNSRLAGELTTHPESWEVFYADKTALYLQKR